MKERYLCVHAHFYQPPRENPWLEAIEIQDSAYPYHDWNERITAECYAPNAACRILDGDQHIIDIVNNYSKISFNFGPTLFSWIEAKAPRLYETIRAADRESIKRFTGHGGAISQAYNHMIMPLANERDKITQAIWGIRDFQHRFERFPEGMWLPEGAVDTPTLETLAAQGIKFTILSPYSAKRVRKIGDQNNSAATSEPNAAATSGAKASKKKTSKDPAPPPQQEAPQNETEWADVCGGRIDPARAYRVNLPSGKSMAVFFYDGPVSRAVAFEDILSRGEDFARRLTGALSDSRDWPQLAHIATDGETYGHHKAHGDMALGYALREIDANKLATLTVYGEFLEKYPPTHEAEVFENSSWSCAHGVERWRSDCGCNSGGHADWNQKWRAPLRAAFDWLRDCVAPLYEKHAGPLLRDVWAARNDYIDVVLDRSPESMNKFFEKHATRVLTDDEVVAVLKLLELQRHAMLMYTSCGWFFDELSGIETLQAIQYAGRVVQLAQDFSDEDIEFQFVDKLALAKSNISEVGDGRGAWEKYVVPMKLDLLKVGAHYGVSSLFEGYGPSTNIYSYQVERLEGQTLSSGKTRISVGQARITSDITRESAQITYAFVTLGDHEVTGGVRNFVSDEAYKATAEKTISAFQGGEFVELVRALDLEFGAKNYTLKLLFRDEQRKILDIILRSALQEAEAAYRQVYENRAPLMRFVVNLGLPPVQGFEVAAEFTINADIRRALAENPINIYAIRTLVGEAKSMNIALDSTGLEFALRRKLEAIAADWRESVCDLDKLSTLEDSIRLAKSFPFEVRLWEIQNAYFDVVRKISAKDDPVKCLGPREQEWREKFSSLGDQLSMRLQ
jgi:alpha-amylase/alpha-mannosidase (GH57 family)